MAAAKNGGFFMLQLQKGHTTDEIIVTLNEKRTLESGYYLSIFTHQTTKQQVTRIFNFAEDNSDYPDRYNSFDIETDSLFGSADPGFWSYQFYEQQSPTNTDPAGLNELECGVMRLLSAENIEIKQYDGPTGYKQYNGS